MKEIKCESSSDHALSVCLSDQFNIKGILHCIQPIFINDIGVFLFPKKKSKQIKSYYIYVYIIYL